MKRNIQKILHLFGYEIKRWRADQAEIDRRNKDHQEMLDYIHRNKWLTNIGFKSVLDIGANTGQFAKKIRLLLPEAAIFSFEPIPSVFEKLKENFKDDVNFTAYNVGLGDKNGTEDFYLNEFSDSSSFLKMKDLHKENFPPTVNESKIELKMCRLDDLIRIEQLSTPYLIKLDVQGLEEKVIKGGKKIIENAEYIITEVSFVELYENQPLFDKIYNILKQMNFQYMGNFDQLSSYISSEIMQADAIFKKIRN